MVTFFERVLKCVVVQLTSGRVPMRFLPLKSTEHKKKTVLKIRFTEKESREKLDFALCERLHARTTSPVTTLLCLLLRDCTHRKKTVRRARCRRRWLGPQHTADPTGRYLGAVKLRVLAPQIIPDTRVTTLLPILHFLSVFRSCLNLVSGRAGGEIQP